MKAIVDSKIPYIRGQIERLVDEVIYMPGGSIDTKAAHDAEILIVRTRTQCNRDLLHGSSVKFIVTATIGYDHIDTEYCKSNGIQWANCPGCNAKSVAQYVFNSLHVLGVMHSGKVIAEGMTIGVVGAGHVGSLVVKSSMNSGLSVIINDPPLEEKMTKEGKADMFVFASLNTICEQADIITFHTPLTYGGKYPTYHIAGADFFRRLKHKPIIINASRGGVVDEHELKLALKSGMVSHVVIDTWEHEPQIDAELLSMADIATPHIAGYSANGKRNATLMSLESVRQYILHNSNSSNISHKKCDEVNFDIPLPDLPLLTPATLIDDSTKLKENIDEFEDFRNNYPQRAENEI